MSVSEPRLPTPRRMVITSAVSPASPFQLPNGTKICLVNTFSADCFYLGLIAVPVIGSIELRPRKYDGEWFLFYVDDRWVS